jgi:DNA mismatch endonuclease (patch repair protein)
MNKPREILDSLVSASRSRNMSAIRGKDTAPELIMRRLVRRLRYQFETSPTDLPGRPDIVLRRRKIAIFVHGCFWHRHAGCRFTTSPATRREFWKAKFDQNVRRDWRNVEALRRMGWRVLVVWECALKRRAPNDPMLTSLFRSWISSQSAQDQITTTAHRDHRQL